MKFASIGDICVDTYPDFKILGGTSYNSAVIARKYGADVSIVSAIGQDDNAAEYKKSFNELSIDYSHVQISSKPTSAVHITLDENNSPVFGEWELGALEDWSLTENDLEFIQQHDIAKMIFLKPLEKNFRMFCDSNMSHTIKVGDFDGDSQYSYTPQDIEKYIDGIDIAVKSLDINNTKAIEFLQQLAEQKNKIVLVTLGKNGSICFSKDKIYKQETEKLHPTNTTGFGDAFLAVFLIMYVNAKDIQVALQEATKAIVDLAKTKSIS